MSKEPINRAVSADESETVVPPNHWRTRIRIILEWSRKNLLVIIPVATAISATSAYFA